MFLLSESRLGVIVVNEFPELCVLRLGLNVKDHALLDLVDPLDLVDLFDLLEFEPDFPPALLGNLPL